jgi:hypothetical protein
MGVSGAGQASVRTDMDDHLRITYDDIATTPLGQALGELDGNAVAHRLVRRMMAHPLSAGRRR